MHIRLPRRSFWPGSRMVAEIQRKIIKRGKRNVLSRLVHASSDKETIAAWRSDLNRMLLVFNVRSIVFVRSFLTISPQTELAVNTHVTVSNTLALVSDIHRNMLGGQGGTDCQNHAVGDTHALQHVKCTLTVTQTQNRSAILNTVRPTVLHLHLVYLGNPLPRCRGFSLDVKS